MIKELRDKIVAKKISATEVAKEYGKKAKALNKEYNSFVSFTEDLALEQAKAVDERIAQGKEAGKLAGVPIAVKDNMLVRGYPATNGSNMLARYIASFDADVVKFLKEEGALIIGKTNMDDAAMGSSSETSHFGPVKSNVQGDLVPGGSSGGSAVAVSSGQVVAALGSDTGGSIRQPASFTGIIGLKPTYGRVSRSGLIAMASSLDQIGSLTKTVDDAALLLEVISQGTRFDGTYARKDFHQPRITEQEIRGHLKNLRIGVPEEFFGEGLDAAIERATRRALGALEKEGATLVPLSLPSVAYALACYYVLMPAEVSSNLARYDGIRYSPVDVEGAKGATLEEAYGALRYKGFGKEVRRRIVLGTYVLSAGYVDKYYLQAQRVREKITDDFKEAFNEVDIIAGPTSPTFPFRLGEKQSDPLSMYLSDIYTVAANIAGLPGISLPLPGLPLPAGLQLMAPHFEEERLLIAARGYELVQS